MCAGWAPLNPDPCAGPSSFSSALQAPDSLDDPSVSSLSKPHTRTCWRLTGESQHDPTTRQPLPLYSVWPLSVGAGFRTRFQTGRQLVSETRLLPRCSRRRHSRRRPPRFDSTLYPHRCLQLHLQTYEYAQTCPPNTRRVAAVGAVLASGPGPRGSRGESLPHQAAGPAPGLPTT